MTVIKKTEVVPYNVLQMFDLVTAVEKYPDFLAWCQATKVHNRTANKVTATIHGVKLGIHFSATIVYSFQSNQLIDIHISPSGPFKFINGNWRFSNEVQGSRFGFELQYEFKNAFMGWTLTPFIKNEAGKLLKEFIQRAKSIYG